MILVSAFQLRIVHDSGILGQCWSQVLQPQLEAVMGKGLSVATIGGGGKGTGKVPSESHGPMGGGEERT